jgi:hypothetical protein
MVSLRGTADARSAFEGIDTAIPLDQEPLVVVRYRLLHIRRKK